MTMQLFSFFFSSTSYRVRIALQLKRVAYDYNGVDLRTDAHRADSFTPARNATAALPVITMDDGMSLGQSLAIIDYLDATHPEPRLIPADPLARARVMELSYLIACDIHPVNNLRILKYLQGPLGHNVAEKDGWYAHWIAEGMAGVEQLLTRYGHGAFCFGDAPTMADCCLIPQIANAERTGCDLTPYPRAMAIYAHAMTHPAFIAAKPQNQPDFVG